MDETMELEFEPLPAMKDGRSPFVKWVNGDGPHALPRYVYVASSWRNNYQIAIVTMLRSFGLEVYDYRNPVPGNDGFRWTEIDPNWLKWTPADWRKALGHEVAQRGYRADKDGMDRADCCVLVLPCGRSAHLEAGYMAGMGLPVFTLALEPVEPELMTLLLGPKEHICTSPNELFDRLGLPK